MPKNTRIKLFNSRTTRKCLYAVGPSSLKWNVVIDHDLLLSDFVEKALYFCKIQRQIFAFFGDEPSNAYQIQASVAGHSFIVKALSNLRGQTLHPAKCVNLRGSSIQRPAQEPVVIDIASPETSPSPENSSNSNAQYTRHEWIQVIDIIRAFKLKTPFSAIDRILCMKMADLHRCMTSGHSRADSLALVTDFMDTQSLATCGPDGEKSEAQVLISHKIKLLRDSLSPE